MAWSVDGARAALESAGILATDVRLEARDGKQVARLSGDRLAWFAETEEGRRRLALERRVLGLLARRCTFQVPRLLHEATDGSFDVRAAVPGVADPWALYERIRGDAALGERIGRALGAILAEQHTRIGRDDVAGWIPARPEWPDPLDSIRPRLERVVADAGLRGRILALLGRYEDVAIDEADRALVHADLGLHNLAVDPETSSVRGVFDYDGAAWADRHHDFRYFVFDVEANSVLSGALAVYEPAVGRRLSRERIALYNGACAASYLAFRDGIAPDERSCGRTLAEDLAWMRVALERVGE